MMYENSIGTTEEWGGWFLGDKDRVVSGRVLKTLWKPSSKASYFMHTYHVQVSEARGRSVVPKESWKGGVKLAHTVESGLARWLSGRQRKFLHSDMTHSALWRSIRTIVSVEGGSPLLISMLRRTRLKQHQQGCEEGTESTDPLAAE